MVKRNKQNSHTQRIAAFQKRVWKYFRTHGRSFPWRETRDPYAILVSEVMLQQTQTDRVVPKYDAWLKHFPDLKKLAAASRGEVLAAWQGLGYNRRAIALQEAARAIVKEHAGNFPRTREELMALPGIGPYTAGAVRAFAFEEPEIFIETNIRRAFIHEFFSDKEGISDRELVPLIADAVRKRKVREWYYALMDYGAMLGRTLRTTNPNRKSSSYARQGRFEGSRRQLRGKILAAVLQRKSTRLADLAELLGSDLAATRVLIETLQDEGFVRIERGLVRTAE